MSNRPDPRLLIDGYNVLFHGGLEGTSRQPGWLDAARQRFVAMLESKLTRAECRRTEVVFDASEHRSRTPDDYVSAKGIQVVYAVSHDEADDLIEEIIARHSHPKQLEVVSSDNRLRTKASRRRATSTTSEEFLDLLEELPEAPPESPSRDSRQTDTPAKHQPLKQPNQRKLPTEEDLELVDDALIDEFLRDFGPDEGLGKPGPS